MSGKYKKKPIQTLMYELLYFDNFYLIPFDVNIFQIDNP